MSGVGWPMFPTVTESQLLIISGLLPGKLLVSQGLLVGRPVVDLVAFLFLQLMLGLASQSLHSAGLEMLTFVIFIRKNTIRFHSWHTQILYYVQL